MNKPLITAIHVDDDPRSLELMRLAANDIHCLNLRASFTDPDKALDYIREEEIDLVLLDLEMPGKDGFWLARQLADMQIGFIFVTAHSQYALAAFEACALDYLLKPVDTETLKQVLDRYQWRLAVSDRNLPEGQDMQLQLKELMEGYLSVNTYPKRIFVSLKGYTRVIHLDDIIYIAAAGSTTTFVLKNAEHVVSKKNMKTYSDMLEKHPDFVRISRSNIVNRNAILYVNRDKELYSVKMSDSTLLELSRRRRKEIFALLLSEKPLT